MSRFAEGMKSIVSPPIQRRGRDIPTPCRPSCTSRLSDMRHRLSSRAPLPLVNLRRVPLHPPEDGNVIYAQPALTHHLLEIPVA